MAVEHVYTYKLHPEIHLQELGVVLALSHEIGATTDQGPITFIYRENGLVYPHRIPTSYKVPPPFSVETFLKTFVSSDLWVSSKHQLHTKGFELVKTEEHPNYTTMIDDLERRGKIKTKSSKNYMANDPRKFWFMGDEHEYEVDCLGTRLCLFISEKVQDAWSDLDSQESS